MHLTTRGTDLLGVFPSNRASLVRTRIPLGRIFSNTGSISECQLRSVRGFSGGNYPI